MLARKGLMESASRIGMFPAVVGSGKTVSETRQGMSDSLFACGGCGHKTLCHYHALDSHRNNRHCEITVIVQLQSQREEPEAAAECLRREPFAAPAGEALPLRRCAWSGREKARRRGQAFARRGFSDRRIQAPIYAVLSIYSNRITNTIAYFFDCKLTFN